MAENKYWDSEKDVADIPAGQNVVKIQIVEKNGKKFLHIREWYWAMGQELKPGKHGLAVLLEGQPTLDALTSAIAQAGTML